MNKARISQGGFPALVFFYSKNWVRVLDALYDNFFFEVGYDDLVVLMVKL